LIVLIYGYSSEPIGIALISLYYPSSFVFIKIVYGAVLSEICSWDWSLERLELDSYFTSSQTKLFISSIFISLVQTISHLMTDFGSSLTFSSIYLNHSYNQLLDSYDN